MQVRRRGHLHVNRHISIIFFINKRVFFPFLLCSILYITEQFGNESRAGRIRSHPAAYSFNSTLFPLAALHFFKAANSWALSTASSCCTVINLSSTLVTTSETPSILFKMRLQAFAQPSHVMPALNKV